MTNTRKLETETIARALVAAMLRLGVGTAVFQPIELAKPYKVRCRNQADGSIAVIVEEPNRG